MEIKSRIEGETLVVCPEGDIDASNGSELTEYFKENLRKGHTQLIADFSKVDFISSAGLRVLLATVKDARMDGGDLRISSTNDDVKKVLTVSGFDRLIKIFPNVQSALESYAS